MAATAMAIITIEVPIIVQTRSAIKQDKKSHLAYSAGIILAMLIMCTATGLGQYDRLNTGVLTPGATANYRFADPNELPITITLLGPVARPGRYEISRKIDLLNLVALAGGWLESADLSDVRISRVRVAEDPLSRNDLKLSLEDPTEVSPKFLQLQEGDYVYVGTSKRLTLPIFLSIVATAATIVTAIAYVSLAKR